MATGSTATDDTVTHGIQITAKWAWTTSIDAGRWSNPQQGIKPKRVHGPTNQTRTSEDGHGIRQSKLKIRGQGEALAIRFESEDGKDFQLLGWAIPFTAESTA